MGQLILLPPDTMKDVPELQRQFRLMFCGQEIPGLVSLTPSRSGRGDTVLIEILQDCVEVVTAPTQTGGDGFYWALFDDADPEIVELADGGTTLYRTGTDMAAFLENGQWFAGDAPFEIAKLVGPLTAPILQKPVPDLTK